MRRILKNSIKSINVKTNNISGSLYAITFKSNGVITCKKDSLLKKKRRNNNGLGQ
jgi:hypothetical protein